MNKAQISNNELFGIRAAIVIAIISLLWNAYIIMKDYYNRIDMRRTATTVCAIEAYQYPWRVGMISPSHDQTLPSLLNLYRSGKHDGFDACVDQTITKFVNMSDQETRIIIEAFSEEFDDAFIRHTRGQLRLGKWTRDLLRKSFSYTKDEKTMRKLFLRKRNFISPFFHLFDEEVSTCANVKFGIRNVQYPKPLPEQKQCITFTWTGQNINTQGVHWDFAHS